MADLDVATLASVKRLVIIAATWGEGEPPSRAAHAYADLMGDKAPRLEGVEFGVLALGDTAYVEFCAIGKAIDERLAALGAKRVVDRIDCDLDFATLAADWISNTVKALAPPDAARGTVIAVDFGKTAAQSKTDIVEAEVTEHVNLNSSRSDKETIHLALTFDGAAPPYEPGNSLDVYPENDPADVDELLKATGLSSDATLRDEFIKSRDITHAVAEDAGDLRQRRQSSARQGADRRWPGAGLDFRPAADRPHHAFPDRAHSRTSARVDATAGAARLFDRIVAPRGRRRGTSAHFHRALRKPRPRPQGRGVEPHGRAQEARRARAREAAAEPAFRAARCRPRHHHGRAGDGRRAVPRLRAGAPRHGRQGPQLAVLRRPTIHPRFPLPARVAGRAQGRLR